MTEQKNENTDRAQSKDDRTGVYPVMSASVLPVMIKKVPDIATGGTRNRRFAAYISAAIIRDLTEHQDPIILQGDLPQLLVDGDSLQDVKERVFEELEAVFKNAQDLVDGKITMEDLEKQATEQAEELEREFKEKAGLSDLNKSDARVGSSDDPTSLKLVED